MLWKIVMTIGILGTLLGLLVTAVSALLPIINGPRTSWEEAMFGIIPGIIVLIFSFIIFVIGLLFVLKNRKKLKNVTQ